MSRYHSYLNSAKEILSLYKGEEPLSSFIKKYFAQHKKAGSGDRRAISHLCYCYFRMGQAAMQWQAEERILAGLFLCSHEPNELLQNLRPEWNEKAGLMPKEKLSLLDHEFSPVFPWKEELSEGMEYEKFSESFFVQPDLFLRIRPGHTESVLLKLNNTGVDHEFISPFTILLPNNFKADQYFELDKEVVVQDYNSQQTAGLITVRRGPSDRVWDCCAGSGGKSIMLYDLDPGIDLVVSDIRESILSNLEKRFKTAGIKKYKSFTTDLSSGTLSLDPQAFNFILADVPCSGSGTWGRTPEQLTYFTTNTIDGYVALQKKIVSTIIPCLQPGGYLLYITCSVFKKENEEMVDYLKEKFRLQLVKMELLKGYQLKADTMFGALLQTAL